MGYAILAWGHAAQSYRVFKIQRKMIRIISGLGYRSDCKSAFTDHNILTFPSMYVLECLTYIKSNLKELPTNADNHNHNTRKKSDLSIPFCRLSKSQNSYIPVGIKMFNKLPSSVQNIVDIKSFRVKIKRFLISKAFYSIGEFMDSDLSVL